MNNPQVCPERDRLRLLLDGSLSVEEQASLSEHLETCVACRSELATQSEQSDDIVRQLGSLHAHRDKSPALEEVMNQLKADTVAFNDVRSSDTSGPSRPTLDFLSPSANPRHLGRLAEYEILEVIGRGGMGTVLKARDSKLERLVAVKVLNPELASSGSARARFLREARSAAAVTHEHVVTIHAVDDSAKVPFLVMEYIVGVSLEDRIQRTGQLRVEEVLRIGLQIAAGLSAAHAQGLVHRDIKPSNILLENGVERVKITDFGLARVVHEAQLTQTNTVAGTPQYMSPEQARGEQVDHRSDLFSLGCVMYAMCTGRSPFRAETPTGAIHRVCEDSPRPIGDINLDIPDYLAEVIDRLLEKRREDRFQTAAELADLLGKYLAHVQRPSEVTLPPMQRRRGIRGERRWKISSQSIAWLGAIAVVVGTVAAGWWYRRGEAVLNPADSGTEPRPGYFQVDIQPNTTRFLDEGTDGPRNNFAALQRGLTTIQGIPFDIGPRYIQLGGDFIPSCSPAVRGIQINRRASSLHFLHGTGHTDAVLGLHIANYVFHYDDGTSETMELVTGRHLNEWWGPANIPRLASHATPAWTGTNPVASSNGTEITVYLCSWKNPYPDKAITSVDFVRTNLKNPSPFCLAITCDDSSKPLPPEVCLVNIKVGEWFGNNRHSVVFPNLSVSPITGGGFGTRLVPPGQHRVEVRDGATVIRRGDINVREGSAVFLSVDSPQLLFPLPPNPPACRAELTGQSWTIRDVALSRDGNTLATAAGNGTVVVWQREGTEWVRLRSLPPQDGVIRCIAFSGDDRTLLTACESGTVRLWEVASGGLVQTLSNDDGGAGAAAFSPDGSFILSGNADGTIDVWDTRTFTKVHSFQVSTEPIRDLVFSTDGTQLATCSQGSRDTKIWNVSGWQLVHTLLGHADEVTAVAFSPDGKTVASASLDSTVKLWAAETGNLLRTLAHPKDLLAVAFDPTGKTIAAGGVFQTVRIWDVASGQICHDFQAHWSDICSLVYGSDGQMLITAGDDNCTREWCIAEMPGPFETTSNSPLPSSGIQVHRDWSVWAAFSQEQDGLVTGAGIKPYSLVIRKLNDLSLVATFSLIQQDDGFMYCQSLIFTPGDGRLLTCLSRKGKPRFGILDPQKRLQIAEFEPGSVSTTKIYSTAMMSLSADGTALVIASDEERLVTMVDPARRETLWSTSSLPGKPIAPAIAHDGHVVAVSTDRGEIHLLDPKTGQQVREPLRHGEEPVWSVNFSIDGTLVSADAKGSIKFWTPSAFEEVVLPQVHHEAIYSAQFSPDGRYLATAGGMQMFETEPWKHQGEICVWNVADRKPLATFSAHYGCVTSAVFSPNGKNLATTGRDGKMNLWDVAEILRWGAERE